MDEAKTFLFNTWASYFRGQFEIIFIALRFLKSSFINQFLKSIKKARKKGKHNIV